MSEREQDLTRSECEAQSEPGAAFQGSQQQGIEQGVANTSGRENIPIGQQAGEQIAQAVENIQQKSNDFITESSEQVAETLQKVSQCLRQSSQESEQEHPLFGRYVRSAADSMSRFSDSLRHKDIDFFVRRGEDMARHQPGVFMGSAFTMGFAIGRFLKSQSSRLSDVTRRHDYSVEDVSAIHAGVEPEVWH